MEEYCLSDRAKKISEKIKGIEKPVLAMTLGSGWGNVVQAMEDATSVPYSEIGMPECGVAGHKGVFVFGKFEGVPVVVQQGRYHMYEGRSASDVVLPVAVMRALGAEKIILTNAAGGINLEYEVGDLMFLKDHINMTGRNPLAGAIPTEKYPIFIDMGSVYDKTILSALLCAARETEVKSHEGVYMQVLGPSFETPSEIRAFRTLGADAVGMSTVVEAIFAKYLKMQVGAISCITNKAAGVDKETVIRHEDVLRESKLREKKFALFLQRFVRNYFD